MRVYGLTGGIACGKSTVSALLRERGLRVIDADVLARDVVGPGQAALEAIGERFPGVIAANGTLDRIALGKRVFADAHARAELEAIVHPRIAERFAALRDEAAAKGESLVIYDAALIVERNLHTAMDGLVVVQVPPEVQLTRLMARDGLSEADAKARIASQLPIAPKVAAARWIVDNGGPREATAQQVDAIVREMRLEAAAR